MAALLAALTTARSDAAPLSPTALFMCGRTFQRFLDDARAQRPVWFRTASEARIADDQVDRFRRAARGLALLIVAEDWCPDSAQTVPYIHALAASTGVPLRIVTRAQGASIMRRHPAPDGRLVTPLIVLLRDGVDVGAWAERPAVLQAAFASLGSGGEGAAMFAQRRAWYEQDAGRTAIAELVDLSERVSRDR